MMDFQFEAFSKKGQKLKKSISGEIGSNACCPRTPPQMLKGEGEKTLPPSLPRPDQDLREGGSVRGKPIGTDFSLPMTINDPPACTGSWAPQWKPKTLCKLEGVDSVKDQPKSVPMGLPRTPPPFPEGLGRQHTLCIRRQERFMMAWAKRARPFNSPHNPTNEKVPYECIDLSKE